MALHKLRFKLYPKRDIPMIMLGALLALGGAGLVTSIKSSKVPLAYQPAGITIPWAPATVTRWRTTINTMAQRYNVDPNLIAIIMTLESGGDATVTSEAGAVGLMQITPPTAGDIAKKFVKTPVTTYSLKDPKTNIEFGAAYLAYLRDTFGTAEQGPDWNSTVELVAAGYNGGPGAAHNLRVGNGLQDTQTVVYSRDAFNMWRERHVAESPTFDRWKERGGSSLLDGAKTNKQP